MLLASGCSDHEQPARSLEIAVQGINAAAISPDGTRIIAGAVVHGTSVWQMPEFERLYDWRHDKGAPLDIVAAAFSPDGSRAVTCDSRTLVMWNVADGSALQYWGTPGTVRDVAILANGHEVLIGLNDHSAVVFDATNGAHRVTLLHDGPVNSVSINAAGTLAITGAEDNSARVWSLETGEQVYRFEHANPVTTVAISDDGTRAFSAAINAESTLWDLDTGKPLRALAQKDKGTTRARFSADGRVLLVGNIAGEVRQYAVSEGTVDHTWAIPGKRSGAPILALGITDTGKFSAVSANGQYSFLN